MQCKLINTIKMVESIKSQFSKFKLISSRIARNTLIYFTSLYFDLNLFAHEKNSKVRNKQHEQHVDPYNITHKFPKTWNLNFIACKQYELAEFICQTFSKILTCPK